MSRDPVAKESKIHLPVWYRVQVGQPQDITDILTDYEGVLHNLVILFEDTLYYSCINKKLPVSMQYSRVSNDINSLDPLFHLGLPLSS